MEQSDPDYLLDIIQTRADDAVLNICEELGFDPEEVELTYYGEVGDAS